jgi:Lrp/AsnC family transcriptional regulator for asnA, asnC and gidA
VLSQESPLNKDEDSSRIIEELKNIPEVTELLHNWFLHPYIKLSKIMPMRKLLYEKKKSIQFRELPKQIR